MHWKAAQSAGFEPHFYCMESTRGIGYAMIAARLVRVVALSHRKLLQMDFGCGGKVDVALIAFILEGGARVSS